MAQAQGQKPQGPKGPQGPQGGKPTAKSLVKPMGYVPEPNEADLQPEFDEENNRFVIQLYDGDCELLFNIENTEPVKTITLLSTNIPETARGQGIGNKLAKSAFEYAIHNKMDVVIKCPFVANHFKDRKKKYIDKERLRVTGRYPPPTEEIDKNY